MLGSKRGPELTWEARIKIGLSVLSCFVDSAMPRVVKSPDGFSQGGDTVDKHDFELEMISVIEAVSQLISGYQQKDRKPSQNDKTEHGLEKTVQNQGQVQKCQKLESILRISKSTEAGTRITIDAIFTILMGRESPIVFI
ncbi:hypothetical protein Tco_0195721 [Tanacetum coccineum]